MTRVESRIQFDETDWLVRVGNLQIAESNEIFGWSSSDGVYNYYLTGSVDYREQAAVAIEEGKILDVNDPDYFDDSGQTINHGKWAVSRESQVEKLAILTAPMAERRRLIRARTEVISFIIDETTRKLHVIDVANGFVARENTFRDTAELTDALDDLAVILNR